VDIRNLPALCGDHIRRLGQIYRSNLPEPDKERAFEVGLRDAADCVSCKTRRYSATSGPLRMKVKICVVGDKSAEKAAILSPFVQPNFDDRYIQTLGTQVSKKELVLLNPASGEIHVDMTVWNILGHRGFRELLKEAYFYAARGVLCVCDGTRSDGLGGIDDWVPSIFDVTGRIPVTILVRTPMRRRRWQRRRKPTMHHTSLHRQRPMRTSKGRCTCWRKESWRTDFDRRGTGRDEPSRPAGIVWFSRTRGSAHLLSA